MVRKIKVKSEELGNMFFSQVNSFHQGFLLSDGNLRIMLRDIPHYTVLRDNTIWNDDNEYTNFLENSWKLHYPDNNTRDARIKRLNEYQELFNNIKQNGVTEPIKITTAPDGQKFIIDGNHRASIAFYLNIDVPAIAVPLKEYLLKKVNIDNERYGSRKNIPYQSIYFGSKCLLKGRRPDIFTRFCKLNMADIRGKSILDMGSNIATSSHLAWYYGAKDILAIEYSPRITLAALRIGAILNSKITGQVHDLSEPLSIGRHFDTMFLFSIWAHVKKSDVFVKNILDHIHKNSVIYFEGHERSSADKYELLFKNFNNVDFIGYNADGIHSKKSTRPFWRLSNLKI